MLRIPSIPTPGRPRPRAFTPGPWACASWIALSLVAALACGEVEPQAPGDREIPTPAPDFELVDLGGETVRLADYRGRRLVIDFWATWCAPCVYQVPELNAFHRAHRRSEEVAVIGVAVDFEGAEVVAPWVAEQGVEYPILIGTEALAQEYGIQGFPAVAIIGPGGDLETLHVGLIGVDELETLIEELARQS